MNLYRISNRLVLLIVALLLLGAACSGQEGSEPAATQEPDTPRVVTGAAQVESVAINIMESFPVQVSVTVRGSLPDGCTEVDRVDVERQENTFKVTVVTVRPAEAVCVQVLGAFEERVALDVAGLPAGTFTVDANGVRDTFELALDNVPQDAPADGMGQPPPGALVEESFDDLGLRITRPGDWTLERLPGVYGLVPSGAARPAATHLISFSFIVGIPITDRAALLEGLTAHLEGQGESGFSFGPTFVGGSSGIIVSGLQNVCQLIVIPGGGSVRTITISPDACGADGAITNPDVNAILDSLILFEPTM